MMEEHKAKDTKEDSDTTDSGKHPPESPASHKHKSSHKLKLRPPTSEDCHLLWQWSNDPVIREASFNTQPIPWEEHVKWFNSKLHNPAWCCYIILNDKDLPIGVVRADTVENEAEISISISSNFRDQGYGTEALRLASKQLFRDTAISRINAYIKPGNTPSLFAFTNTNYQNRGVKIMKGTQALHMTLDKMKVKKVK